MMDDNSPRRRRNSAVLVVSLAFLAVSVVLFFRTGAGLTRWLVLLACLSVTMVFWRIRR